MPENKTLNYNTGAMIDTSQQMADLNEECRKLKDNIKNEIEGDLRAKCKGNVAEAFIGYFNDQVYPNLTAQVDTMLETAEALKHTGVGLGRTEEDVLNIVR